MATALLYILMKKADQNKDRKKCSTEANSGMSIQGDYVYIPHRGEGEGEEYETSRTASERTATSK